MFFLLTGSAGSGKSATLRELSRRDSTLAIFDQDDLRPPMQATESWWLAQTEKVVAEAVSLQPLAKDTVTAGWASPSQVRRAPSAAQLEWLSACLLDCSDPVRVARITARSESGTWRTHSQDEIDGFLRAAAAMRRNADQTVWRLDTSDLTLESVVDLVQAWIAEARLKRLC